MTISAITLASVVFAVGVIVYAIGCLIPEAPAGAKLKNLGFFLVLSSIYLK